MLVYSPCMHTMFIGEYTHTVDEKGRLAIPKKFRDALGHGAVLTRGVDTCLFLYTTEQWKQLADQLATLSFAQANTRAFSRLMLAGAMDVTLDTQGRIMLPEYLRTYGQVTKSVTIAGLYNRLELWDTDLWNAYTKETEAKSAEIAEQMAILGV